MSHECLRTDIIDIEVDNEGPLAALARYVDRSCEQGRDVLRCGLVGADRSKATLEVCTVGVSSRARATRNRLVESAQSLNVALVIPTGVGASIGGFIGDAGPVAQAFETAADLTILHPNIVNGADLYGAGSRSLYVDGYTLDEFFAGRILLGPRLPKRIGLIIDLMEQKQKTLTLNAANACCAVWGIDMVGYAECIEPTRGMVQKTAIRHFIGELHNPTVLF